MAKTMKTCEVMQYMEYMDCDLETIEKRIVTIPFIKSYALILHDRDVRDDGTPKPPHFHAVLTFSQAKTFESVATALGVEPQYVNKIRTTTKSAQMYLIHRNDKTKFQYPPQDVKASFDFVELVDDTPVKENISEILKKIDAEIIKPYNIQEYVTIETYAKNKRLFETAFEYVMRKKKGVMRNMKCFYFFGGSGTGKTTYAKIFANQNGWSTFVSSGGKNPLDDYKGEDCIILDDIRGSVFSLADFLKLTDNNTDSMVGCRYYNKSLAYCKAIICTSVMSLDELYSGVTDENKEPKKQLYRRFETAFEFTEDKIRCYVYDGIDSLVYRGQFLNPVALMYNKEVAKRSMQDFAKAFGLEVVDDSGDGFVPADDSKLPF